MKYLTLTYLFDLDLNLMFTLVYFNFIVNGRLMGCNKNI